MTPGGYGIDPALLTSLIQTAGTVAQTGISTVGQRRTAVQTAGSQAKLEAIRARQAAYAAQVAAQQAKAKQTQYIVYGFVGVSALLLAVGIMKRGKK
jgi:hypothetical protein